MNRHVLLAMAIVFGAVALVVGEAALVELFWAGCGPLDVHTWPSRLLCWHLPELIASFAATVGLLVGFVIGARGVPALMVGALVSLAVIRLRGAFPFGDAYADFLANGCLYVVLPSVLSCALAVGAVRMTRRHAL